MEVIEVVESEPNKRQRFGTADAKASCSQMDNEGGKFAADIKHLINILEVHAFIMHADDSQEVQIDQQVVLEKVTEIEHATFTAEISASPLLIGCDKKREVR